MFKSIMQKIVRWLDPKLDRFRPVKTPPKKPKYTPKTIEEFIEIIQRTPKSILSNQDRNRISAIMSFDDRKISELMIPKSKMVFVNHKEILGPLVLDKLYQSGFTNFPVIDDNNKVKGIIHTEALNALEIKRTDRADKYLDNNIQYLHTNDSLKYAVDEIKRTNSYFFLILDSQDSLAGFFTVQMLLDYLLSK